jgi:rod shape-determining protein MreD
MIERVLLFAENRYARLILIALLFLALQTTVFNDMRPFGVCLQVMLLLAASAGLARGSDTGAIAGFIVGLLYDMVLATPMGLCAAVFATVGYLAGLGQSLVYAPTWWSRMLLASAASAIGMVLLPIASTVTGATGILNMHVLFVALIVGLFNGALSIPVERLCRWALTEPVAVR